MSSTTFEISGPGLKAILSMGSIDLVLRPAAVWLYEDQKPMNHAHALRFMKKVRVPGQ
jgi:hypothetical protein